MSLTFRETLGGSPQRVRNALIMIAIVVVGLITSIVLMIAVSPLTGVAFLVIFVAIFVVVRITAGRIVERHAVRLNGQGMRVKQKILVELAVQSVVGERRIEYSDKSGRFTFMVTDLHASKTPHYHCWYTTFDDSELRQRGIINATTQAYFIRTDDAPIMKTMRIEQHSVRTGKTFSPGAGPRGEQVDSYDVVADDQELTELLQVLRTTMVIRS